MNKPLLLEQYDSCYNVNGWFVAARNAIDGLSAEQAAWKPAGSDNSIWETLAHLCFYNYAYLQRFKGVDYKYPTADNNETFRVANASEEEWGAAIEKFDAIMTEWRSLIASADDAKLEQQVSATNHATWGELISYVNTHNAYHAGQILLLRKLQGAWNPEKGVS